MFKLFLILLCSFIFIQPNYASEKVNLQLVWKNQFQFAGYYMAKEKGFYNTLDLDVHIKEYQSGMNNVDDVISGKTDFAIGRSSLVLDRLEGKPVVMLAAIFQHSPEILLAKKRDDIQQVSDLEGKRIMLTDDQTGLASINSMLISAGVRSDMFIRQQHSFDVNDLINDKTDAIIAYLSNEPYALRQANIDYTIFNPKDFGFDLYSDILFTSQNMLEKHPEIVKKFRQASLQGWEYALQHIDETVDVIFKQYNTQNRSKEALHFEGMAISQLVDQKNVPVGDINPENVSTNIHLYRLMGLVKGNKNLNGLIYQTSDEKQTESLLTEEEKSWIKDHPVINVAGEMDWAPFDFVDNGVYQGIAHDYLNIVEAKTGLTFNVKTGLSWNELIQGFKDKQFDLLPALYHTVERESYTNFTFPYFKLTEYIYARKDQQNFTNIKSLYGKTIAVVKGFELENWLKEHHPKIKRLVMPDILSCLKAVDSGLAEAFIGDPASTSYVSEQNFISSMTIHSLLASRKPVNLYMGVRKDWKILAEIISRVFKNMDTKTRRNINRIWIPQTDKLNLTNKEKQWLDKKIAVRYVYDPDWAPFEWTNDVGKHAGIISDILKLIKKKSALNLIPIKAGTWAEAIDFAKDRHADMYSGVGITDERKSYMNFTEKNIFSTPYVFVSRKNEDYLDGFDDLENKKIAVVGGYTINGIMNESRPDIPLVLLKSTQEGFEKLLNNEIDIFLVNTVTAKYFSRQEKYKELKLAYKTQYKLNLKIAIRNDWPPQVISIFNKAIAALTEKELSEIYDKWTALNITTRVDYSLLMKVAAFLILLIFIFVYWNRKLNALVKAKTKDLEAFSNSLELQVLEKTQTLMLAEEKTRLLLTSVGEGIFGVGSDGLVNFINPAALKMLQYNENEILGHQIHALIHHSYADGSPYPVDECPMFHALSEGKLSQVDNEVLWRKDGTSFPIEYRAGPIIRNDQISGSVVTFSDISRRKRAHNLLIRQQHEIEEIHKHTQDSIEYAALIQSSLIPEYKIFQTYFQDSFAIWHPKDIVGGDIYLVEEVNKDEVVIMVIDCTGHGVPGAFVTMLVKAVERQLTASLHKDDSISPANMLAIFNRSIKHLLQQEDSSSISNAGFDGSILYYNKKEKFIRFAGANTPLFIIQNDELKTIKGDRHSIGYKKSDANYIFNDHQFDVSIPTQIYLTTDGYPDQNGGEKGFPFGKKRFIQLLLENSHESFADQQEFLLYELQQYQQDYERNDDVTVIGLKI
ncbi:MAG: transporter substrate-binding domain-containing protein [gamma proteobacterium symbiont of Taylorina sp.]|nr:transporter substrate-binding domain-containing protein [gamma proteobacterium symbiont of Taylorina sp.]